MKNSIIKLLLILTILFPLNVYSGPPDPFEDADIPGTDDAEEELIAYYDLRDRQSFVQVTNVSDESPLCIHVQVFQQDRGCTELDFNDELTANDTVVYNLDDMRRNNGSEVPINLQDDSYGYVAVSAFNCGTDNDDGLDDNLIGNFRIIDDSGYEYRMNMVSESDPTFLDDDDNEQEGTITIPFNTVAGAGWADIVAFLYNEDRDENNFEREDSVFNIESGVTFSVFQIDENEERLSCDQVTFACGEGKVMNYGINNDYPNSRGGPVVCSGAGLLDGQTHGYISLEDGVSTHEFPDGDDDDAEFVCLVGINNGNGTGSMDECRFNENEFDD